MRLRNDPEAINKLVESGYLIQKFPHKNSSSDVIELGAGKGEMICQLAQINPKIHYIAVEKYDTVAWKIAKLAKKMQLKNLSIICEDIEKINEFIENSVDLIWITFSDPWPKKRHVKRRLTYKTFLDKYKKLLSVNGVVKLKTDNDGFFEFTLESLKEYQCNIIYMTRDLHNSPKACDNIMTGYEQKWSQKGKNINYVEFNFE